MKNIRLFLQFALFVVIVVCAVVAAPHLGQMLADKPFEAGYLSAPEIDHGHGDGAGHGEEHGEEHGGATDVHGDAGDAHGQAVAEETHETAAAEEAVAEEPAEAVEETAEQVEEGAEEAAGEAEAQVGETAEETTEAAPAQIEEQAEEQVEGQVEEVAEAAPAHPGDMVIQPLDPATATQAPVAFSHAKHEATECAFCHHKGGNQSCSSPGCHTDTTTKKLTGATENVSFEAAFHVKGDKSCVGCHRALKSGPTKCTDCHPK